MVAPEDLVAVGDCIHRREETAVEPPPSLQDKFRHAVGHVGFSGRGLDILQDPSAVALCHDLEAEDSILGQIHVRREDARVGTVHLFTLEVLLQRALAVLVVLQGDISVRRERTGKDGDEAESGLEWLVEDVADLVLEVLRRHERVEQLLSMRQHDLDLTTRASAHRLQIERLPQVINGVPPRLGARVDQDADVGIQHATECLEEPAVRIDLLLVLLLETEDHLHRCARARLQHDLLAFQLQPDLGRVLVDVRGDILAIDLLLRNAVLVDAQAGKHGPRPGVDLGTSVADHAHDDLLPRLLAPRLAVGPRAHVFNVLEHTDQGPGEEELILVVHRDGDKELRVSRLGKEFLTQREALVVEIRGIARRSRVAHMRKLVACRWLRVRHLVQELRGDWAVEHKVAVEQLDLFDGLPPSDGRRTRRWRGLVMVLLVVVGLLLVVRLLLAVRTGSVRMIGVQDWNSVVAYRVLVGVRAIVAQIIVLVRGHRGLVGLGVVGIVVCLGIQRVLVARVMLLVYRVALFVGFVVPVRVVHPLDGVLPKRLETSWPRNDVPRTDSPWAARPGGHSKASGDAPGDARTDHPRTGSRSKACPETAYDCGPAGMGSWSGSDCRRPHTVLREAWYQPKGSTVQCSLI